MNFKQFLIKEVSLRQILKPVPQNPEHHAEGDVFTHTRMVRSRLPLALNFIARDKENPDSVFKNLDMNLSDSDLRVLKLAAWFHDIGKASASKFGDDGKVKSHGHESPKHYMPMIEKLTGPIKDMYLSLSPEDMETLHFVIDNHMSLQPESGFPKKLYNTMYDGKGMIRNERRPKLLVTFILMDRTGRLKGKDFNFGINTFKDKQATSIMNADKEVDDTIGHIKKSGLKHIERIERIKNNGGKSD